MNMIWQSWRVRILVLLAVTPKYHGGTFKEVLSTRKNKLVALISAFRSPNKRPSS